METYVAGLNISYLWKSRFNHTCVEWLKTKGIISVTESGTTGNVRSLIPHSKKSCFCLTLIPVTLNKDLDLCKYDTVTKFSLYAAWPSQDVLCFLLSGMFLDPYVRKQICKLQCQLICTYEGELHENLKLHVASGAASFTPLLRRRVAFLHRTATYRPLFKPWVSLLSTYRQSSCVSNFYRTWETKETMERTTVTLETEQAKWPNPGCLWWWWWWWLLRFSFDSPHN